MQENDEGLKSMDGNRKMETICSIQWDSEVELGGFPSFVQLSPNPVRINYASDPISSFSPLKDGE